jgi:hypothetical protein
MSLAVIAWIWASVQVEGFPDGTTAGLTPTPATNPCAVYTPEPLVDDAVVSTVSVLALVAALVVVAAVVEAAVVSASDSVSVPPDNTKVVGVVTP